MAYKSSLLVRTYAKQSRRAAACPRHPENDGPNTRPLDTADKPRHVETVLRKSC